VISTGIVFFRFGPFFRFIPDSSLLFRRVFLKKVHVKGWIDHPPWGMLVFFFFFGLYRVLCPFTSFGLLSRPSPPINIPTVGGPPFNHPPPPPPALLFSTFFFQPFFFFFFVLGFGKPQIWCLCLPPLFNRSVPSFLTPPAFLPPAFEPNFLVLRIFFPN